MRPSLYKIIFFLFLVVLGYLQYVLWFEDDGIFDLIHLKKESSVQMQQNEQLKQQNQKLSQQVENLKNDPEMTEGRARNDLGMIKKGEKFYQIVGEASQ